MKPVLQLYALCLTDLNDYKESYDYWDKIDEELKLKPLYQDPIKRKRRLDNLKLLKVQEILFDDRVLECVLFWFFRCRNFYIELSSLCDNSAH